MSEVQVIHGDCISEMRRLKDAGVFVQCIVTDPPYHLGDAGFMGKAWDSAKYGVAFQVETWKAAYDLLAPGGHLLAFSSTRTYHRMACAIEDAGFEVRDCIQWLYGTGFPKSLDVSKQLDRMAGAEREVVGANPTYRKMQADASAYNLQRNPHITAPATDAARQWQGWGTALKPANEPICVARKPLQSRTSQMELTSEVLATWEAKMCARA